MKKNLLLVSLWGILSCFMLSSCNNENEESISLPDSQVYITKMNVTNAANTRSTYNCNEVQNVSFEDFISGKSYDFIFLVYSDNTYGIDIDKDGTVDMMVTVKDNEITATSKNNEFETVVVGQEDNERYTTYTLNAPQTRVTYRHISWFSCVERLTLNEDVAMGSGLASMFRKYAFGYVAGAAAVICLNDSNRWDVS